MTTTALASPFRALAPHEHSWLVQSRHGTSEGLIVYVRCSQCGAHRVDRLGATDAIPLGVSKVVLPADQSEPLTGVAP